MGYYFIMDYYSMQEIAFLKHDDGYVCLGLSIYADFEVEAS